MISKSTITGIILFIFITTFSVLGQEAVSLEDLSLIMLPDDHFSDEGLILNENESGTFEASASARQAGFVGGVVKKWLGLNLDSTRSCTLYEYEVDILLFDDPAIAQGFVDSFGLENGEVYTEGIGIEGCLGTLMTGMSKSTILKAVGPFVIGGIAIFDHSWYTPSSIQTSLIESISIVEQSIQNQGWVDSGNGVTQSSLEAMLPSDNEFDNSILILREDSTTFITVARWASNLRNFSRGYSAAQIEQAQSEYGLGGIQVRAWSDMNYACTSYSYHEVGIMPFASMEDAENYLANQDVQDAYILDGQYTDFEFRDGILWADGESQNTDCGTLQYLTVKSAWKVHDQFVISVWISYYSSGQLTADTIDDSILASIETIEANIDTELGR